MKCTKAAAVRRRRCCSWIRNKGFAALLLVGVVTMSSSFRADAFSAASGAPKPQWLVVDFDETCTVRGTTSMLPRLAALAQSKLPGSQNIRELSPDASIEFQSRLSIWSLLEDEYFRKYSETLQSILDGEKNDGEKEPVTNLNLEQLAKSIDRLDDVSTEITNEVSKWRVLGGLGEVSDADMLQLVDLYKERQATLEPKTIGSKEINQQELLECFELQPGCLSVLQRSARSQQYGIGVLSINWCPAVIRALLVRPLCDAAAGDDNDQEPSLDAKDVRIWCNSVDGEGIVDLPVPGAISKQDQIRKLQEQDEKVVYVGDSLTDLLAILQADVGILLGGSQSAVNMAQRYGVVVKPLSDFDSDAADATVWKADHWDEIGSFLDSMP